jgi:hypothetical protein
MNSRAAVYKTGQVIEIHGNLLKKVTNLLSGLEKCAHP